MNNLVIAGYGGLAREVKWLVDRLNASQPLWNFLGFIDTNDALQVIGNDDFIINCKDQLSVVIAIADPVLRTRLYERYRQNPNVSFPNLLDPSVICSDEMVMGQGNIICAGTVLTVNITLGDFVIINMDCTVGHDAVLGSFVTVNPGVNISGNANIGISCFIGAGAQILQGHTIGRGTSVASGAVVNRSLPENVQAVGAPERFVSFRKS
ncbi:MAG: NeuD/PglB/VioB family sugar acetyltransferase [Succinivibrio sp.]|nr:NeuD/PglB/VioB family sugar acetyltransferase [Succinivibrio sp.]